MPKTAFCPFSSFAAVFKSCYTWGLNADLLLCIYWLSWHKWRSPWLHTDILILEVMKEVVLAKAIIFIPALCFLFIILWETHTRKSYSHAYEGVKCSHWQPLTDEWSVMKCPKHLLSFSRVQKTCSFHRFQQDPWVFSMSKTVQKTLVNIA